MHNLLSVGDSIVLEQDHNGDYRHFTKGESITILELRNNAALVVVQSEFGVTHKDWILIGEEGELVGR